MGVEFSKQLRADPVAAIPGMVVVHLPVHGDNRGWFKENWQREKMIAAGLPDFAPVQNNISFNATAGTTRGIHAEPWDKYVSVATGRIFGAWVDLREGPSFGNSFTVELDSSTAVFVPRGVGNAFQTLEDGTAYTYLVNDHWSAEAQSQYTFLNLADETAAIEWPISLADAELSDKDRQHPRLEDVVPMGPRRTLVLGAAGQLGLALREAYAGVEHVDFASRSGFDLANPEHYAGVNWRDYDTVINAGAYTKVDEAETPDGRKEAWAANVTGVALLAKTCIRHGLTLVHVSSDYVFDGTEALHTEEEPVSPLGVYGQTKAAGEAVVSTVPRHYIVRTSWVIGEGNNFVSTMQTLAARGITPSVVNDQIGRLTFTNDLAAGIKHLLDARPEYGLYNLSNGGEPESWADIARLVYQHAGRLAEDVAGVTTAVYFRGKETAQRPLNSTLDLTKIIDAGFTPAPQREALRLYLDAR
ncbi:sugar nucleotide-binding protein [Paeniglutamicibacter gangotriensis]|uniref:dTDP-4-dehydrorhamnose reductase n=1 Tax=Paeniglutamicibacter gangotriensis Lz1y TaxID=1276920 RepID=M7NN79_9MICC|nr:bifunctional dTDP-4-dehydrorhamnose 3,5-epimerase family protein/NAD(P)-dependent oxidoreductase [Paeniglutamicibacter gangotriensis]EMQ99988.1 dTDP-4-dehydrorhamnose reductase [Paeniglutamicibacter gangotriensis Lz1y]